MASKSRKPPDAKGQVIFYTEREKAALKHIGNGSVAEGNRISIRWAAHFYNVGLRPDHNLNNVGLSLLLTMNMPMTYDVKNTAKTA